MIWCIHFPESLAYGTPLFHTDAGHHWLHPARDSIRLDSTFRRFDTQGSCPRSTLSYRKCRSSCWSWGSPPPTTCPASGCETTEPGARTAASQVDGPGGSLVIETRPRAFRFAGEVLLHRNRNHGDIDTLTGGSWQVFLLVVVLFLTLSGVDLSKGVQFERLQSFSGSSSAVRGGQPGNPWRPAAMKALAWSMRLEASSRTGQVQLDAACARQELHRRSSLMMWEEPSNANNALLATVNQTHTPPNVSRVQRALQPAVLGAQRALPAMKGTINQMQLRPRASLVALPERPCCWVHHLSQIACARQGKSSRIPLAWIAMRKACIVQKVALLQSLKQLPEPRT